MKTIASEASERLKKVLVCDKSGVSQKLYSLIKNDVCLALNSYMFLSDDSFFITSNIDGNGEYNFSITFRVSRLKELGLRM